MKVCLQNKTAGREQGQTGADLCCQDPGSRPDMGSVNNFWFSGPLGNSEYKQRAPTLAPVWYRTLQTAQANTEKA